MNKKENLQKIQDMRRHTSETLFRAAVQHLFDTGHQNFDEQNIAEAKEQIQKTTKPNAIMTADFQCELLDCCLELSRLPIWDVLLYVKLYMGMDGDDILLIEKADRAFHLWSTGLGPPAWRDDCLDPKLRDEIVQEMVEQHQDEFTTEEVKAAVHCVVDSHNEV